MNAIANLINPKAAAELQHSIAENRVQNLLTCRVYAHADGEQQIIVTGATNGVVLARIPKFGSLDAQRILACNIAYAMNLERGHE